FDLFATMGPEALDLRPLLASPLRERLKTLDLSGDGLLPESWEALGGFPALSTLLLAGINADEIPRFARSLRSPSLRLLEISIGSADVKWMRALGRSPGLSGLLSLSMPTLRLSRKTPPPVP